MSEKKNYLDIVINQWNDGTVSRQTFFLNLIRLAQRGYAVPEICGRLEANISTEFEDWVARFRGAREFTGNHGGKPEEFDPAVWEKFIKYFEQRNEK